MVDVSVVIAADRAEPLMPLLISLDQQSVPGGSFEVVTIDRGLNEQDRAWLDRAAARRPNVVVVDRDASWAEQLHGEFVLLGAAGRLFPRALERLLAFARDHDVAVVGSRVVRPRTPVPGVFLADALVTGDDAVAVVDGDLLLVRRDLVRAGADRPVLDQDFRRLAADADTTQVGVLAGYPGAVVPTPMAPDEATGATEVTEAVKVRAGVVTGSWRDGSYAVSVEGRVTRTGSAPVTELRPAVLVRHAESRLSLLVPTTGEVGADGRWRCAFELDPTTALLGEPLSAGTWHLDVAMAGDATGGRVFALPATPRSVALVGEAADPVFVAVGATPSRKWLLDVGPLRESVIEAAAADGKVSESHRGSLLEVALPALHTTVTGRVPGMIALDTLQLPAWIDVADGAAVLRSYVSGLTGEQRISAAFGRSPMRATGLGLQVHAEGSMTLVDRPVATAATPKKAPAGKAPAKKAAAKKVPAKKAPASPVGGPPALRATAGRVKRGLRRRIRRWRATRAR